MKRYVESSSQDERLSAIDLGDEFYDNYDGLVSYLKELPEGTRIYDIVHSPGDHWAGSEVFCEKQGGYDTVYWNPWGISPADAKFRTTWWQLNSSKSDEYTLAKIITRGTRYYCTKDVFEDDDAR